MAPRPSEEITDAVDEHIWKDPEYGGCRRYPERRLGACESLLFVAH